MRSGRTRDGGEWCILFLCPILMGSCYFGLIKWSRSVHGPIQGELPNRNLNDVPNDPCWNKILKWNT